MTPLFNEGRGGNPGGVRGGSERESEGGRDGWRVWKDGVEEATKGGMEEGRRGGIQGRDGRALGEIIGERRAGSEMWGWWVGHDSEMDKAGGGMEGRVARGGGGGGGTAMGRDSDGEGGLQGARRWITYMMGVAGWQRRGRGGM